MDDLSVGEFERIVAVSNKIAAITASRRGAIPAMPSVVEVFGE